MDDPRTTTKSAIEQAVVRAVEAMSANIGEPLTIDDMARTAMYSKFHFSREFQRVTGVSPRRFLSALRFQEAKRLLIATGMTVTEISHRVGYTSVGTFSSRFTSSVGVSPTAYRQLGGFTTQIRTQSQPAAREGRSTTLRGEVRAPVVGDLGLIFLGLFPGRIPQGRPVRCTVLTRPGPFVLEDVPPGSWHLLGHSVPKALGEQLMPDQQVSVGSVGPIEVRPDVPVLPIDFRFRAMRTLDPPVLLALLDVRSEAVWRGEVSAWAV
ncbi:AraC family transcriptional regulator [Kitasatospora sp. GP82]|uniref:AraC family transcriptional regulator n=1 Tax=Kitasatospora sp. GP82 TaxID=3035089 RepID=UPI002475CB03|nr:AraC family transcriptional regulator [Kitasatospora sp. GP82]MDH6124908.1 AraC family transcriptional regulator [Kitasatospora sp. GP82]